MQFTKLLALVLSIGFVSSALGQGVINNYPPSSGGGGSVTSSSVAAAIQSQSNCSQPGFVWVPDTNSCKAPINFINVLDYGAKGDGTTDDAAAIAAAVAVAQAAGGGVVYFPIPSSFYHVHNLQNSPPGNRSILFFTGLTNVTFLGESWQSLIAGDTLNVSTFEILNSNGVVFKDLSVSAPVGAYVEHDGWSGGSGIKLSNCQSCIVDTTQVSGTNAGAVYFTNGTSNSKLINSYIHNTYGMGFNEDDCTPASATSCGTSNPGVGNEVAGNHFLDAGYSAAYGSLVLDSNGASTQIRIHNNKVEATSASVGNTVLAGIDNNNTQDTNISDNTVVGMPADCIVLTNEVAGSVVENNISASCGGNGVHAYWGLYNSRIQNLKISATCKSVKDNCVSIDGQVVTLTGTLTSGSTTITGLSTVASLLQSMTLTGTGIQAGTVIQSIGASSLVMTNGATTNGVVTIVASPAPNSITGIDIHDVISSCSGLASNGTYNAVNVIYGDHVSVGPVVSDGCGGITNHALYFGAAVTSPTIAGGITGWEAAGTTIDDVTGTATNGLPSTFSTALQAPTLNVNSGAFTVDTGGGILDPNGTLSVGGGRFNVLNNGNVAWAGTGDSYQAFTAHANMTVGGNQTIAGTLAVTGQSNFGIVVGTSLNVNVGVTNYFQVSSAGNVSAAGSADIYGTLTAHNNLAVTNGATVGGNLGVTGTLSSGFVTATGLAVNTGATNYFQVQTGTGNLSTAGTGDFYGTFTAHNNLVVTNGATVGGTLGVTGASNFTGAATFTGGIAGNTTVTGSLSSTGAFSVSGSNFTVDTGGGVLIPNGTLSIGGGRLSVSNSGNIGNAGTLDTYGLITGHGGISLAPVNTAISGTNQASEPLSLTGSYWTGTAAANDQCSFTDNPGTGSNPAVNVTLNCTGSSGSHTLNVPNILATSNATVQGTLSANAIGASVIAVNGSGTSTFVQTTAGNGVAYFVPGDNLSSSKELYGTNSTNSAYTWWINDDGSANFTSIAGNFSGTATGITGLSPFGENYVSQYPSTCTVGGTSYTTQLDCAFYQTIANGGSAIVLGAGNYVTNACLVEPTLGTQVSIIGQVDGFNGLPTQISAGSGCTGAVISHPDILTSQSSPYNLRLQDFAVNAQNIASQCIAVYAEKLSVRRNISCRNYTSTTLAPVQFGDPSPSGGYQSAGYQDFTEHIYIYGKGNGNSSWATVTPTQSSGTPSIAVSSGGSYLNANPPVYLWGFQQSSIQSNSSATQPCTTMGTATANMTGSGPYSVSSVTLTGYSGCSGLLYAYIPDIAPNNYGFEEAETDSHFFDIEVQNSGSVAGIHYSSGSNFIGGDHVYGGSPTDFRVSNPQKAIIGLEADTTNIYGIRDDSGKNVYTSTEFVTPQLGSVGFYMTSGGVAIIGSTCGAGSITSNNFTLVVTSSGAIGHGNQTYPAEVIDATQCDNLSKVDYVPSLATPSISITAGGNISASSGTTNAVEYFLSSGTTISTGNATNVALKIENVNASPTADLVDFLTGTGPTQIASIDYLGNGHFTNYISGALTGDGTTGTIPSNVFTLATVNSNVGTFGSTTNTAGTAPQIPSFTVNGKGLITGVTTTTIGVAASYGIGTSGATLCLASGACTYSGTVTATNFVPSGGGSLQNGTSANSQITPGSSGTTIATSVAGNVVLQVNNTNASPSTSLQQWAANGSNVALIGPTGIAKFPAYQAFILYSAAGTALPTCVSGIKGETAVVSDATSPSYMGAYTSGGAITAAVICSYNGTTYSWLTH